MNHTSNQPISQADEITAVALLARGDTHQSIAEKIGISPSAVTVIKKRNAETLDSIKNELIVRKTKQAKRLLDQSHDLIEKKLGQADRYEQDRLELQEQLEDNEIDYSEYSRRLRKLPTITLAELTAVSKEMFNQSQIEEGKPTSIGAGAGKTSDEAATKLQELIDALHGNDEVKLLEIMNA